MPDCCCRRGTPGTGQQPWRRY